MFLVAHFGFNAVVVIYIANKSLVKIIKIPPTFFQALDTSKIWCWCAKHWAIGIKYHTWADIDVAAIISVSFGTQMIKSTNIPGLPYVIRFLSMLLRLRRILRIWTRQQTLVKTHFVVILIKKMDLFICFFHFNSIFFFIFRIIRIALFPNKTLK